MTATGIVADRIAELLPDARVVADVSGDGWIVTLPAERLGESMQLLRDDPSLGFAALLDLFAIDRMPAEPRFQVVYRLVAPGSGLRLRVAVQCGSDGARLPSLCGVWRAANWLEREAHELLGIVFDGHPDLRPLLLDESVEGHPLRKDFAPRGAPQGGEVA